MKKRLTFLSLLFLLLTLGVGNVWGTNAIVGTTLWAETWTSATTSTGTGTPTKAQAKASVNCSTSKGTTMYGGASITYSETDENVYCRAENTGGGTSPELLLSSGKTWTISGIPTGGATEMTLTYSSNNTKSSVAVTGSPDGISITGSSKSYTISNAKNASTFTLVFSCSGNTRIDNVSLTVKTAGSTPAVPHTVTLMDNNATLAEASANAGVTLPSRTGCTGYTFAGWTASWTEEQDEWITTAPTIIPAGAYSPSADINLYPVYTKSEGTEQYKLVSSLTNGKDYIFVTRNTAGSGYAFSSAITTGTSVTIATSGSDKVVSGTPANSIIWTAATGWSLTTKDNTKTNTKLKINGSTFALDATGSTNLAWTEDYGLNGKSSGTTKYYLQCSNGTFSKSTTTGSSTNRVWAYEKTGGSTTYYISVPNCCTPLGQINGSIDMNHLPS